MSFYAHCKYTVSITYMYIRMSAHSHYSGGRQLYELYGYDFLTVYLCSQTVYLYSPAKPDNDDTPETVRAKYFIRDMFLVSVNGWCFVCAVDMTCRAHAHSTGWFGGVADRDSPLSQYNYITPLYNGHCLRSQNILSP